MESPAGERWQTWYETFDKNHSPQQRETWYSEAATAYRWARPRYPDAMVDSVCQQAGLSAQSRLLEIGCGPGIATAAFADKGLSIVGVEPSAAAAELAQKSCRSDDGEGDLVTIINSTFEDYDLPTKPFDAVLAATSFHWISPEVACKKSAAALKPNGSLILLWATPPQPATALSQLIQPIYDRYNLTDLAQQQCRTQDYYQGNFERFAATVSESGFFQPTQVQVETHVSAYSVEKYLALLSTLSPYIALDEAIRDALLNDISDALSKHLETGAFDAKHWFASQVAPLKS